MPDNTTDKSDSSLCCAFRGKEIPVTKPTDLTRDVAQQALDSSVFQRWLRKCEQLHHGSDKRLELHGIELQSVDLFGARGIGFIKLKSHCTLVDQHAHVDDDDDKYSSSSHSQPVTHPLPGICFLRGDSVAILVALICRETHSVYSVLVEQPRVPIGQAACLELPAGMMDDESHDIKGTAVQELQEECGICVNDLEDNLVDLTELAGSTDGLAMSPGGCDERCRFLYLEKDVSPDELEAMKGRLTGLREHGELITLRIVPMDELWSQSMDAKAMITLFLVEQLRRQGKLPPVGGLATHAAKHGE